MKQIIGSIIVALLLTGVSHSADSDWGGVPLSIPIREHTGLYQREALQRLVAGPPATVESLTLCVVRISFSDRGFGDATPHDSLYYENELRHLREYYDGASIGRFSLDLVLFEEVVVLSRPEAYYGEDGVWEIRIAEMVMETVEAIDSLIDFSAFEGIALIHADAGQETDFSGDSPWQLWSGFIDPEEMAEILADTLGTPGVPTSDSLNGEPYYIDNVIVWPEEASQDGETFGSLGIYAYQIGQRIGMMPLFDTTYDSQGIGSFGLMGYGLYNYAGFLPAFPCAFHRYLMGWVDAVEVLGDTDMRLHDINSAAGGDTCLVRIPVSSSEYFLLANRVHDKNFNGLFDPVDIAFRDIPQNEDTLMGAEFDFYLTISTDPELEVGFDTGSGLMIWHIDESVISESLAAGGYPNDDASLKGVDLEEADGIQDLDKSGGSYSFGSYYDSFREGGNASFGRGTNPSSDGNGGAPSGISIENISVPGTYMNCTIRIEPPLEFVRTDFDGWIGDLSPIPSDLDLDGVEDLVMAADTGLVLVAIGAGSPAWDGGIDTLVLVPDAVWSGPPVLCNAGGADEPEIFITTDDGRFYAFHSDGSSYPVGDAAHMGSLELLGTTTTAPIAMELDGDPFAEVLFLSSTDDSTFLYLVGCSIGLQDPRWETAGLGIVVINLMAGRIISHMSLGIVSLPDRGWIGEGFFAANILDSGDLFLYFVPMAGYAYPIEAVEPIGSIVARGLSAPASLCQPAAGDVNADGEDEGLFAVQGAGLVYLEPSRNRFTLRELRGERTGAPALSDVDGDGVMETVLRDEYNLYLMTGFGSPLFEWPIEVPDVLAKREQEGRPASPLVADLDGNGRADMLYRIGGDIWCFSPAGDPIEGLRLIGEGTGHSTPALIDRGIDGLFLFVAGSYHLIDEEGGEELSSLRRYSLDDGYLPAGSWPFFRRDAWGSARQERHDATTEYAGMLDEGSYVCYPNPVKQGFFTVRVTIFEPAQVKVTLMNIEGEKVFESNRRHAWPEGSGVPFEERISTAGMAGGVYICRLEAVGGDWAWSGVKKVAITR
jgi:M6 family metalloprotease-like protein